MKNDQPTRGALYISGPYIYSNNSEMVAFATPEVVAELKRFGSHFDCAASGNQKAQVENHELVAFIPPNLKL